MDFSGKVIVVFGASGSIGSTLCEILYQYGATIVGVYYQNKIDKLYDNYQCNLRNELEVKELFNKIIKKHDKIDAVINCATYSCDNDIYDKSLKEFMEVVEVNLGGTYLIDKYASINMDRGVIINISSTDGIDTFNSYEMDYASSKAGIINLTQNMALRFPNLKVCAIAPNYVDTPSVLEMDPLFLKNELKRINQDKLIKKESVALKIIEVLINDDYVSGAVIRMDGKNE